MSEYKIRGKGDARNVHDETGALIGTLRRHQRDEISGTIRLGHSAAFRKTKRVWWTAKHWDGRAVLSPDRRPLACDHMKDFREPHRWALSETLHVAPSPTERSP